MHKQENSIETPLITVNGKPIVTITPTGDIVCHGKPSLTCHMCGKEIDKDYWRMNIHNDDKTINDTSILCGMECVQNKINEYHKYPKYTDITFEVKNVTYVDLLNK